MKVLPINTILVGDVIQQLKTLPDESFHCVITSPPYLGLRDYKSDGQLGLERSLKSYTDKIVEVFREIKRVMRQDATAWINLGDSFCSKASDGLKAKDLMGVPWKVAFALQEDGFWLRQDVVVWEKTNPMPESIQDRCTRAHEYIFMMTKSASYFYDAEAIKEQSLYGAPNAPDKIKSPYGQGFTRRAKVPSGWDTEPRCHTAVHRNGRTDKQRGHGRRHDGFNERWDKMSREEQCSLGRNKRSVWTIATEPFSNQFCRSCERYYDRMPATGKCLCGRKDMWLAHFATFPQKLIEPCILAGTSEHGCCQACGTPWVRSTKTEYVNPGNRTTNGPRSQERKHLEHGTAGYAVRLEKSVTTTGWKPSCECGAPTVPCVILDPFMGSGTTALVALRAGRNFVGIDLNEDYVKIARHRIAPELRQKRLC